MHEYLDKQRWPLTTQQGLTLEQQRMIDAHNLDELREAENLTPKEQKVKAELEAKLKSVTSRQPKPPQRPMTFWKQRAAEEVSRGYQPGNQWEVMLRKHLRRLFPHLVVELNTTGDLTPYCQVMTANAMNLASRLEEQGTPPETARELAMEQLLQRPDDEQDKTYPWETEGAMADMLSAVERYLTKPPPSERAKRTPLS